MLHLAIPLLLAGAFLLLATSAAFAEDWPGAHWNDKLPRDMDQWKPLPQALSDLSPQGDGPAVICPDEKRELKVPLTAGLTVKEAFLLAACSCGYDIQLDGGKLTAIKAAQPAGAQRTGIWAEITPINFADVRGTLLLPKNKTAPVPWVWYAPSQGYGTANAWITKVLLDRGIAVAMVDVGESWGNAKGRETYQAFYEKLVKDHGVARKVVLWPQSRGGLMLYNWAAEHPECVQASGAIYAVGNLAAWFKSRMPATAQAYNVSVEEFERQLPQNNPIDRLAPLAKAGIPIFHIHGDQDVVVPVQENAADFVARYQSLGGQADLLIIPGKGHEEVKEYFQCQPLADFLVKQAKASIGAKPEKAVPAAQGTDSPEVQSSRRVQPVSTRPGESKTK